MGEGDGWWVVETILVAVLVLVLKRHPDLDFFRFRRIRVFDFSLMGCVLNSGDGAGIDGGEVCVDSDDLRSEKNQKSSKTMVREFLISL